MGFQALGALSIPLDFSYKDKKELLRRKRINEHLLGRMQNKKEKANILSELGTISYLLSEPRKAIEFDDQALAISREIGDRRGEGNALRKLGNAYSELGEPRKAIEFHEQAMKISREIGDRRGEDPNNLGNAHYQLGELHKAIEFYEQALAIAREIGNRRGEGTALWNMSLALNSLGSRAKAIECARAALKIYEEIEDQSAKQVRQKLQKWESG